MNTKHAILVVDDNQAVIDALRFLFKQEGWRVVALTEPARVAQAVAREEPELVLLDMNFTRDTTSGAEGIETLKLLRQADPDLPVILMTAWGTVDRAVEAMKLGARDYVTKPWNNERLLHACRTHIELRAARRANRLLSEENRVLRADLDRQNDFSGIVGSSVRMVELLRMVADVAPTEATVLITGPPGTGKELIAHAIHANSARKGKPFVKVHVGALPEGLFERELFGHVKGAYTDAREDRPGRFAVADGGTLFLDEIGTIGPAQQVKLLRVLQEGEFEPLGSTHTRKVDVRVVAATNADLKAEIAAGRFREDLYYRLNVVEIQMPALRERAEDILLLAERFLKNFATKNRKPVTGFDDDAKQALLDYEWPGNVRELENVIERAVILARGEKISMRELPLRAGDGAGPALGVDALGECTLEELERAMVERALKEHKGNVSRAAQALGLSRAALYRRMEKFGLG
ncbi:MAG TPA: sigma-54 dependent transcriptional regulator [Polyangia bacterium]|nr:sigma-54 dependent transcriptional regulator [Polyangia bacterium]